MIKNISTYKSKIWYCILWFSTFQLIQVNFLSKPILLVPFLFLTLADLNKLIRELFETEKTDKNNEILVFENWVWAAVLFD